MGERYDGSNARNTFSFDLFKNNNTDDLIGYIYFHNSSHTMKDIVHGGCLFSACDEITANIAMSKYGLAFFTRNLKVDYIKPSYINKLYFVKKINVSKSYSKKKNNLIINIKCNLVDENDNIHLIIEANFSPNSSSNNDLIPFHIAKQKYGNLALKNKTKKQIRDIYFERFTKDPNLSSDSKNALQRILDVANKREGLVNNNNNINILSKI